MSFETSDDTAAVEAALQRMGLLARPGAARFEGLAGGVSSDIWRVDADGRSFCVKRALAKLRVQQDWRAPVGRNAYEVAWMEVAGRAAPGAVPRLLGHDPQAGLFAMEFLEPQRHPLWKAQLRDGVARAGTAAAVADRLVAIHSATADDPAIARRFQTDDIFHAIRLEPYLEATARVHVDLLPQLTALVRRTAATKRALVHGDVSPKNILIGPDGPIFLDAECAWYGDPAFDLAFCLNHLLLKCLWTPRAARDFLACFDAIAVRYLAGVDWEPADAMEARTASLLPGLFLARVDGKSPVEYLTDERDKSRVRTVARALIADPPTRLASVAGAWRRELQA
jgi:aminoglycoside phosphotransferase (APT) family kinase protein